MALIDLWRKCFFFLPWDGNGCGCNWLPAGSDCSAHNGTLQSCPKQRATVKTNLHTCIPGRNKSESLTLIRIDAALGLSPRRTFWKLPVHKKPADNIVSSTLNFWPTATICPLRSRHIKQVPHYVNTIAAIVTLINSWCCSFIRNCASYCMLTVQYYST